MNSPEQAAIPTHVRHAIDQCLDELDSQAFSSRILDHDPSLWPGAQQEIRDRLGWLHVHDSMTPHVEALSAFATQLRADGFRYAVLLGMGGSSLGAEVLNQVVGPAPGYPQLYVLDSTVPSSILSVSERIDPAHTLFIVSSKSGGTLEPNVLLEYFWEQTVTIRKDDAGAQFIAITDAGSSLDELARQRRFRHVFLNPSDIGGRYSVLSLFGLVPGAIMGLDIQLLIDRVLDARSECSAERTAGENPAAWLGAYLSACTRLGHDKLTIITSPKLRSFGLWAEQLIAESTGKGGNGIIPVAEEPLLRADTYSADRAFVYIRLATDECGETDAHAAALKQASQPCAIIDLEDSYALSTEFFRWEYATAAAGALLGINPFDQPDVQKAKDASSAMLQHYQSKGTFPEIRNLPTPHQLLSAANAPDYVAIMAYLNQRLELDTVFQQFRRTISDRRGGIATTLGYGPRYLHSTGQLHKGGPNECILIQIVNSHGRDLPVPGTDYSFGVVADAQALGDLQALDSLGRRVTRIVLRSDSAEELSAALENCLSG